VTDLFHLAERADWQAAVATGAYRISTRGRTLEREGFIHLALRHQVRGVAEAFFAGAEDLVLLVIDGARLTAPVRYEAPGPGAEEYPHLYGPLPVDAVTDVRPVTRDADGRFELPE
jgi:uncharacterized protein (DUF952 family)